MAATHKKVMTVFGTRPEAVKMAPVIMQLQEKGFTVCNVVSAQHRQMLDQILNLFEIEPQYDLNIMGHAQTLTDITTRTLERLAPIMESEAPDIVLVQGDTTTTFAASLCAFYHKVAVGHIEAGLRTKNKYSPFPEEINRTLTGVMSDFHFAPTERAKESLLAEGVKEDSIYVTGNTVIDALLHVANLPPVSIDGFRKETEKLILVTAHRRESFGEPLRNICRAIRTIAERFPEVTLVYPVHLNPNVQEATKSLLDVPNVRLLPPLDYRPLVNLMKESTIVLTDSGGIQEEAPSLGKPVLVLREVTERPEGVTAGTAKTVGTDCDVIVAEVTKLLTDPSAYEAMAQAVNPYGDGFAAERIVGILKDSL